MAGLIQSRCTQPGGRETMRIIIVLFVLATTLAGCAQRPSGPPPAIDPVATCTSQDQCDAMWSEALVQLQNLSRMRLQVATDSFAQTYQATNAGYLSGTARRVPLPGGLTAFEASFSCHYNCGDFPYAAVNLFTSILKVVGARFDQEPPTAE